MNQPIIDAQRTTLEGDFVRLRPLRVGDAELTLEWRLGSRASLLNKGSQSVEEQRSWIAARPGKELNYVIETRAGVPIGMLSLVDIDLVNRRAEPARFLIGDEQAAKGIPAAVEALKLLYVVAFEHLGLQRVYGTIAEDNKPMLKWQTYLGMKVEGRLRNHALINSRFQDLVAVGLLDTEYREVTLPRMKGLMAMAAKPPTASKES